MHIENLHRSGVRRRFLVGVVLLAAAAPLQAEVRLPAVVGDHMVLQQRTEAPIWGWASPGERIRVTASWDVGETTTADDTGSWTVRLRTPDAGGPHQLTIEGTNTIRIEDVLIGEVWICSGQSNMEMSVGNVRPGYSGVGGYEKETIEADYPAIRLFDVKNTFAAQPLKDIEGEWRSCTPETVRTFSATGYFFGRKLHRELGVPIGLIGSNWGGTPAEAWTSRRALREMDDFRSALSLVDRIRSDPEGIERTNRDRLSDWWKRVAERDPGTTGDAWHSADFDDSSWSTVRIPSRWRDGELKSHDGIVWFRKKIQIPQAWASSELVLELGPIDDMDTTFFNGVRVGGFESVGHWRTARRYKVPGEIVRAGDNVIAVRVLDTGGDGGLYGAPTQLKLRRDGAEDEQEIELAGVWRYKVGAAMRDLPGFPRPVSINQNTATALYNGMIAPIVPYGIRGAIWYQGESNRTRARQYRELFPLMIRSWRDGWDQGAFPFYFVQIAPYGYGGDTGQAAELREAQFRTLSLPNTGMAVTMDIGNPRDIHPKNKQEVGRRLALWALAKTYGYEKLIHSGPLLNRMHIEGDAIRLCFNHVGGGLVPVSGPLSHFTVAGADRAFFDAEAVIDGETIRVSSTRVASPVTVRYAWGAADEPNLFNSAGLPASSFRTDDWTTPTDSNAHPRETTRDVPWVNLMRQDSLDGWVQRGGAAKYRIESGTIVGETAANTPNSFLCTEKLYGDFELELEFKVDPRLNSGVQIRSNSASGYRDGVVHGYQVEIDPSERAWSAGVYDESRRGWLHSLEDNPAAREAFEQNAWNKLRILAVGDSIKTWINGVAAADLTDSLTRTGFIALQVHGTREADPLEVRWRHIRIRDLGGATRKPPSGAIVLLDKSGDLSHWQHGGKPGSTVRWRFDDGALEVVPRTGSIETRRTFGDCAIHVEFSVDDNGKEGQANGNSGVYIQGRYEVQILNSAGQAPAANICGAIYGVKAADFNLAMPAGAWQAYDITFRAPRWDADGKKTSSARMTVYHNGTRIHDDVEVPTNTGAGHREGSSDGPILFQDHGNRIRFRNVWILPLEDASDSN